MGKILIKNKKNSTPEAKPPPKKPEQPTGEANPEGQGENAEPGENINDSPI